MKTNYHLWDPEDNKILQSTFNFVFISIFVAEFYRTAEGNFFGLGGGWRYQKNKTDFRWQK